MCYMLLPALTDLFIDVLRDLDSNRSQNLLLFFFLCSLPSTESRLRSTFTQSAFSSRISDSDEQ